MAAIDDYLQAFAQPTKKLECLRCGEQQTGLAAALLGSGFQWGLANGEGYCAKCGWPARGIHRIPDVGTLEMVLQYHPGALEAEPEDTRKSEQKTDSVHKEGEGWQEVTETS